MKTDIVELDLTEIGELIASLLDQTRMLASHDKTPARIECVAQRVVMMEKILNHYGLGWPQIKEFLPDTFKDFRVK